MRAIIKNWSDQIQYPALLYWKLLTGLHLVKGCLRVQKGDGRLNSLQVTVLSDTLQATPCKQHSSRMILLPAGNGGNLQIWIGTVQSDHLFGAIYADVANQQDYRINLTGLLIAVLVDFPVE